MKGMGASKNSEFAQMQGAEKIPPRAYGLYVSKKFFTQHSSWDEIWILRGARITFDVPGRSPELAARW